MIASVRPIRRSDGRGMGFAHQLDHSAQDNRCLLAQPGRMSVYPSWCGTAIVHRVTVSGGYRLDVPALSSRDKEASSAVGSSAFVIGDQAPPIPYFGL
ncbi:uncharacterized protein BDV14DRAFT_174605 [Aspergillus stella-maris]|uniref:uncharacterized protein n=1 Tax=Aspergillus stella-maris TaxID=1810926 RepID=UPI003CCD3B72